VPAVKPERPYFETWLKRVGRQLSSSGRLSQVATLLSMRHGGRVDDWRIQLRDMLQGGQPPSMDLLTEIDRMLAVPRSGSPAGEVQQALLF
jgi:hypothetical protein